MRNLEEIIDAAIEHKRMAMGRESDILYAEIKLKSDEVEIFKTIGKYNDEHYQWEIEGNDLYITYYRN